MDLSSALTVYSNMLRGKKKRYHFDDAMMRIRQRWAKCPELVDEIFVEVQATRGIFVTD